MKKTERRKKICKPMLMHHNSNSSYNISAYYNSATYCIPLYVRDTKKKERKKKEVC